MSSDRSKLKLDQQSFETLLAAAYTVQEHNVKQKHAPAALQTCAQCGGALESEHQFCGHCGSRRDEFRPGERLQRNWASLWMMSQKQGDVPRFTIAKDNNVVVSEEPISTVVESEVSENAEPAWADDLLLADVQEMRTEAENGDLHSLLLPSGTDEDERLDTVAGSEMEPPSHWNLRLVLKFHSGDLYLAMAILISAVALGWVIWGTPLTRGVASGPQLSLGERTLVKLGIAEAPARHIVHRGDPNARVWADPHTALYYCDGDDEFGHTRGGHYGTQKEAQLDGFSPAARTPCP